MIEEKKSITAGPHMLVFDISDIPNIYFTSDLHLNHKNIITYSNRPFRDIDDMNNSLINNINNITENNPNAILINCGDFIFSNVSTYEDFVDRIAVKRIYSIIGNHDVKNVVQRRKMIPYNEDSKCVWSTELIIQIINKKTGKIVCMFTVSHYPHCDSQFMGSFNIHGHLHSPQNLNLYTGADINIARKLREKGFCYDVGVDGNNYAPVSLKDILTGNTICPPIKNIDYEKWKTILL